MHLIFDFDGTLVDSFDCVVKQLNRLAEEYSFYKIDLNRVDELRHLSSKELIALFQIPFYKMPRVLFKARKELRANITGLAPFPYIPELINDLFNQGFSLGIVSSNSEDNVISWLKHQNMSNYFDFIHAGSSYFGKKRAIKKVLKMHKIEQAIYIGDETRDIDAAKQTKICSMAVTWEFNSERILKQYNPDFIAHTTEDIMKFSTEFKARLSLSPDQKECSSRIIIPT